MRSGEGAVTRVMLRDVTVTSQGVTCDACDGGLSPVTHHTITSHTQPKKNRMGRPRAAQIARLRAHETAAPARPARAGTWCSSTWFPRWGHQIPCRHSMFNGLQRCTAAGVQPGALVLKRKGR